MGSDSGMNRLKRLAKEGGWIVVGQVATVVASMVLVRVLTEHLDAVQYGQLALGLTVAGLVNQVVMGGVANGISRFYSIAAEKQDLIGYLNAARRLMFYATMVVAAIGLVMIAGLLWLGYSIWIGLAAAILVFSVLSGYNSALNSIQSAARHRAIVAIHGGLEAWLKIGLALGVVLWFGASSSAVVIGYAVSSLVIMVSQLIFFRSSISPPQPQISRSNQWMPQMWSYSLPFSTWGLFAWGQQVSDRWALQVYASPIDVGQYAVLFQLGYTPISLVSGFLGSLLGPILFQRSGDATDQVRNANVSGLTWRMTYITLMTTLFGFVITYMLHEWLFRLLVAPGYRESSFLLPWVLLAGGIFAAGQMLALKLMSEMKSSALTIAKISTALIAIVLNVISAATAGIIGVVVALVAFSVIYFVWMVALNRNVDDSSQA